MSAGAIVFFVVEAGRDLSTPAFSIQLLSSGVTDENRNLTRGGVPATDSTALP
jgi:hypothetical protein